MLIEPGFVDFQYGRMTHHDFGNGQLVNSMCLPIAWWNPNDHNEPFPWPANRSSPIPHLVGGGLLNERHFYTNHGAGIVPTSTQELWCVDSAGADLFDFFNFPTPNPHVDFYGIYWKQIVTHCELTMELATGGLLLWEFRDAQNNRIPPPY